jgi:hypothetical protein
MGVEHPAASLDIELSFYSGYSLPFPANLHRGEAWMFQFPVEIPEKRENLLKRLELVLDI